MDIENLNRKQIILLTLLASFVTSIATGIVTVSLLQQAPPGITQTINRVVERTVEKVVPSQATAVVTTKETTVVVKEDDLITKSVAKDSASLVSLWQKSLGTDGAPLSTFVGWGLVLSQGGIFATDSGVITDTGSYSITTSDGQSFSTKVLSQDEDLGVALLQASTTDPKHTFTAATLGDADKAQLGQSILVFGGKEKQAVGTGIISSLTPTEHKQEGTTTVSHFVGYIDTTVGPIGGVEGGALANIFGEILGIRVGDKETRFVSENILTDKLNSLSKPIPKAQN